MKMAAMTHERELSLRVIAGLDPAIHADCVLKPLGPMDHRVTPGDDDKGSLQAVLCGTDAGLLRRLRLLAMTVAGGM